MAISSPFSGPACGARRVIRMDRETAPQHYNISIQGHEQKEIMPSWLPPVIFYAGKEGSMRASDWAAALVLGLATVTAAQETHQPDDWKKMYDDASTQLRAAQDRKAELAKQNGQLAAQVADLQKQLENARIDLDVLRR